jgi:hypothetical protein
MVWIMVSMISFVEADVTLFKSTACADCRRAGWPAVTTGYSASVGAPASLLLNRWNTPRRKLLMNRLVYLEEQQQTKHKDSSHSQLFVILESQAIWTAQIEDAKHCKFTRQSEQVKKAVLRECGHRRHGGLW